MFQDVRQFSELAHSPNGGFYLFSKKHNMMFTHVPLTHTPQWCDTTAVIRPSLTPLAAVEAFPENAAKRETLVPDGGQLVIWRTRSDRVCTACVPQADVTVCSSADHPPNAVHYSYFKAEHQAGFVAGVGESS